MNLYLRIFIAAFIPLAIMIIVSFLEIQRNIKSQISILQLKEKKHIGIIDTKIHSQVNTLIKDLNLLSSLEDVVEGIKFNDNDILSFWGKKLLSNQNLILFLDKDGNVLSRPYNEFYFGDSLKETKLFKKISQHDSSNFVGKLEKKLSFISSKKIYLYNNLIGYIIVAIKIDKNLLNQLDKGTMIDLTIKEDYKVNTEDYLNDILTYNSLVNKEIDHIIKLRNHLFFYLSLLVLFLSIFLYFIIKKYLSPYTKLTKYLSLFTKNEISLKDLRTRLKEMMKDKNHEINPIIHAILKMSIQVQRNNKKLVRLSQTDQLTKLYNRRKIDEVFNEKFSEAKRYKSIFSIILIDIDHFKHINDTYGHSSGDKVLVELSNLLKISVRKSDFVSRFGGEEFLIVCSHTTHDECEKLCKKIKNLIHQLNIDGMKVTASFGFSQYKSSFETKEEMFKVADDFLYDAKKSGRDCIKG